MGNDAVDLRSVSANKCLANTSLNICYLDTLTDSRGIRGSVEVTAESLFEAVWSHTGAVSEVGERGNEVSCRATQARTLEAVARRAVIAEELISFVRPSFRQHAG